MTLDKFDIFRESLWHDDPSNASNVALAEQYGVSEATIRRWKKKLGVSSDPMGFSDYTVDESSYRKELYDEAVMVTADFHCPLYNKAVVWDMMDDAKWNEISTLIIAGDFWNMDALSRFEPKQDTAGLEKELESGLKLMYDLFTVFDTIHFLKGNHDDRIVKALGYKMRFSKAMEMLFSQFIQKGNDLHIHDTDHLIWNVGNDKWRICHPQAYTQVPLSKGRILADKYGMNIITAHSHHFAQGWSRDGTKIVAEIGGMFDANMTDYLQSSTTYPEWQNGYYWINGNGVLCSNPTYWKPKGQ